MGKVAISGYVPIAKLAINTRFKYSRDPDSLYCFFFSSFIFSITYVALFVRSTAPPRFESFSSWHLKKEIK